MGIRVTALRIRDKFKPLDPTNWLLASIGEKLTIELDIDVEEILITSNDAEVDRIALRPASILVNTTNIADLVFTELQNGFQNYNVGDTITISGSASNDGNYLIYSKNK